MPPKAKGKAATKGKATATPKAGRAAAKAEAEPLPNDVAPPPGLRDAQVAFTGELDGLTREDAEDRVKAAGARVMSSVSGNTTFLIVGSHLDDGRAVEETSKYRKFLELQAKGKKCPRILREPELLEMLGNVALPSTANGIAAGRLSGAGSSSAAAVARRIPSVPVGDLESLASQPWVEKYAPKQLDELLGNASAVKKLQEWLRDWDDVVFRGRTKAPRFKPGGGMPDNLNARAVLVSGPPGIGKTTACRMIATLHGDYEVQEYNASDARGMKIIQAMADGIAGNRTLAFGGSSSSGSSLGAARAPGLTRRAVIIMDEIDGMGGGDRGGNAALIKMIKKTKNPIICICNDHSSPKVRSLAFSCYDIRFTRPSKLTIAQRVAEIAAAEGLEVEMGALEALAESCGNDVRHVLNQLQIMSMSTVYRQSGVNYMDMKGRIREIAKDQQTMMGPFDACKDLLAASTVKHLSVNEALDRFFVDFSLVHLLVQENYLKAVAKKPVDQDLLDSCAHSAQLIAESDIANRQIRDDQQWGLLPTMGFLSAVYPTKVTNGFVPFPEFPKFLGNYSRQSKARRLRLELDVHLRAVNAAVSRDSLVSSGYMDVLFRRALLPLQREDIDGAVEVLDAYGLQRGHLAEHLTELSQHLSGEDEFKLVDPKVKAALTRELNQGGHALRVVLPPSKKRKGGPVVPEGDDIDDDAPAPPDKTKNAEADETGEKVEDQKDEDETAGSALVRQAKKRRGVSSASAVASQGPAKAKARGTSVEEPKSTAKSKANAPNVGGSKTESSTRSATVSAKAKGKASATAQPKATGNPKGKSQSTSAAQAKGKAKAQAKVKSKSR